MHTTRTLGIVLVCGTGIPVDTCVFLHRPQANFFISRLAQEVKLDGGLLVLTHHDSVNVLHDDTIHLDNAG